MPPLASAFRIRDVVDHACKILLQQNSKWEALLDLIRTRTLADHRNNRPIASDNIAPALKQSDRTVRDDTKRINDLLEFLFNNAETLYKVALILAEGRPRKSEYHRLYTFEITANTSHKRLALGKLWLPVIPYVLGEETTVRILHPASDAWSKAAQGLTAALASFGATVTAGQSLEASDASKHLVILGDDTSEGLDDMDASKLPLLRAYHESTAKQKVFLGRTRESDGESVTAILGKQEEDVLRVVDDLTKNEFARKFFDKDDALLDDPLQAILDLSGRHTKIIAVGPVTKKPAQILFEERLGKSTSQLH